MSMYLDEESLRHTLVQSFIIKAILHLLGKNKRELSEFFTEWANEQELELKDDITEFFSIVDELELESGKEVDIKDRGKVEMNMYQVMDEVEGWLRTYNIPDVE